MVKTGYFKLLLIISILGTGCSSDYSRNNISILDNERFPRPIALTTSDIEWFRDFEVSWIHSENGSPAVILPGLTIKSQGRLYESDKASLALLHNFERVFTTFAVYARLKPGTYSVDLEKIVGDIPLGLSAQTEFELTDTHITLIRNAWWRNGFIDFKYPYGSYQYYEADMALKLGHDLPRNSDTGVFELSELDQNRYQKLHKELLFAVLVFVQYAEIKPDHYQLPVDGWASSFVRLHPPTKQQIESYMKNAVRLKEQFSIGQGDSVIDWMNLNKAFSEVID